MKNAIRLELNCELPVVAKAVVDRKRLVGVVAPVAREVLEAREDPEVGKAQVDPVVLIGNRS